MRGRRILLIVGGGIAAYKACELVRLIRKAEAEVTCVLTDGGAKFVTAMSLAALSENPVHTTLWDLKNEVEMGHIQLSRQADLVVVCPATADLLARMAAGIADDLATTLLLATDKPVLAVPAMNVRMWQHAATVRNVARLRDDGVTVMEPDQGAMACGEWGPGRLPEPAAIFAVIGELLDATANPITSGEDTLASLSAATVRRSLSPTVEGGEDEADEPFAVPPADAEPVPPFDPSGVLLSRKGEARAAPPTDPDALDHPAAAEGPPFDGPLRGRHVLITAGPTHEPIDPVRYIANRSSGKQGYAIAAAAARAGAQVTLVSGPVPLPTPPGVERIDVESAREMADAVKASLPADVAIMVAAVADWRTRDVAADKMKKRGSAPPALILTENPDILANVGAAGRLRPQLLIGFAAETENVIANATEKRKRKGADWIIANDVSGDVMGGHANTVHIVTAGGVESLPEMGKDAVGEALVVRIAAALAAD